MKDEDFPNPGPKRFWVVRLNSKSRLNPIAVELRESYSNFATTSRVIGLDYTIADSKEIVKTAELILHRIGNYAAVVGEYRRGRRD